MTQAADQPYGGVPDEVRIYESAAQFEPPLRRACDTLDIPLPSRGCGHYATGEAERFLETLHKRVGETLPDYIGTALGNGTAHPTLHELENVLKRCLANYHCSTNTPTITLEMIRLAVFMMAHQGDTSSTQSGEEEV